MVLWEEQSVSALNHFALIFETVARIAHTDLKLNIKLMMVFLILLPLPSKYSDQACASLRTCFIHFWSVWKVIESRSLYTLYCGPYPWSCLLVCLLLFVSFKFLRLDLTKFPKLALNFLYDLGSLCTCSLLVPASRGDVVTGFQSTK